MNENVATMQNPENNHLHPSVVNITPDHEDFVRVNAFLSEYFLRRGEYESEEIIRARFGQPYDPNTLHARFFMKAIFDKDEVIGARIHQIVMPPDGASKEVPVIVFLMNILVDDNSKNNGVGGLLRQAAKNDVTDLAKGTVHQERPILYVAEMEPLELDNAESISRYKAYIRSGFRLIDPKHTSYRQLDDPNLNYGREMSLLVAKDLNHHVWDENTSISKMNLEQVVAALKFSYTAVGYKYDDNTEPKILCDLASYGTQVIPTI